MPSIDATVAWAVPVEVDVLGAHLEAYVNLQPTINTLRMCHRFGKGEQAVITKLPVELLSEVEDILMAEERRKTREEWETDFRCFQLECDISDHFDPDEMEEKRREYNDQVCQGCGTECNWDSDHDEMVDQILQEYMEKRWTDIHLKRNQEWGRRVDPRRTLPEASILTNYGHIFRKLFGLEMWISDIRVDELDNCCSHGAWTQNGGETTVAYLKLPDQQQEFERWLRVEYGGAIRIKNAKAPTESETRRFKRAMDILGLQPSVDESQRVDWDSSKNEKGEYLVDCTPQLMILLRSSN